MKKTCSAAAEKSSIVRNLTRHLGEMWIMALQNFNMPSSGCTFSSLQIRRSAGNNLHFFSILMKYDC